MRKCFFSLMSLLLCCALSMPVYADAIAPSAMLFDFDDGLGYFVLGILVLVVGFILYRLLRKKNK